MRSVMVAVMVGMIVAVMIAMTGIAAATQTSYDLTHSNVNQLEGTVVRVTVDDSAKTMEVELISSTVTNAPKGIQAFFYNLQADQRIIPLGNYITSNTAGWTFLNKDGTQADGFGNFLSRTSLGTAQTAITFTLAGTFDANNIPPNANNSRFAVHLQYADGCSGWISDGTPGSPTSNGNCTPTTQIPEFPTIALPLLAAMVVVFGFQRRKKEN